MFIHEIHMLKTPCITSRMRKYDVKDWPTKATCDVKDCWPKATCDEKDWPTKAT